MGWDLCLLHPKELMYNIQVVAGLRSLLPALSRVRRHQHAIHSQPHLLIPFGCNVLPIGCCRLLRSGVSKDVLAG